MGKSWKNASKFFKNFTKFFFIFLNIFPELSRDLFKNFINIFYKPPIIFPLFFHYFHKSPKIVIKIFLIIRQNFLRISKMKILPAFLKIFLYFFCRFFFKNFPKWLHAKESNLRFFMGQVAQFVANRKFRFLIVKSLFKSPILRFIAQSGNTDRHSPFSIFSRQA